ncbi:MAG: type II toxin-antitoxin system RatA family toxin [Holosporales bacterium]
MPKFLEQRLLSFRDDDLFQLVADVERYPEFLPWCVDARVFDQHPSQFLATLTIGYGPLRESYTSRVDLSPHKRIQATAIEGPFTYLTNTWDFQAVDAATTKVSCCLDFELDSWLLRRALTPVLTTASRELLAAFERRAQHLFVKI